MVGKYREFLWRHSISIKLMTSFLFVIIPVFLVFFALYQEAARIIQKEVTDVAFSQMEAYVLLMEDEFTRVRRAQDRLLENREILELSIISAQLSTYQKHSYVKRIQELLGMVGEYSEYASRTEVMIPGFKRSMSMLSYDSFQQSRYDFIMRQIEADNPVFSYENRIYICSSMIEKRNNDYLPVLIVTEISEENLRKSLTQFNSENSTGICLLDKDSELFITTQQETNETFEENTENFFKGKAEGVMEWKKENGEESLILSRVFWGNQMCLVQIISESALFSNLNELRVWIFIFFGCSGGVILLFSVFMYHIIKKPVNQLLGLFSQVEEGNTKVWAEYKRKDEFLYIFRGFNRMVGKITQLIEQVYKQKIYAQKAELKKLQSQINPHFLYNSFFTLSLMAQRGDLDLVEEFTEKLGEYFSFIHKNEEEDIPLVEEIHHARIYADIQEKRFSNTLMVDFEEPLPSRFADCAVPRLIVQPVLENAFVHGLKNKTAFGLLKISYQAKGNQLAIIVEDNGEEITDEEIINLQAVFEKQEGPGDNLSGIVNIHRRLQIRFGQESGIKVGRSEEGGLKVSIYITFL